MYLKLAGDYWLPGKLGATKRSMVCCCSRSDNAFSTDASRQVCIAIRCVLLGHLSQGQDRCPGLQYQAGGRGVRLSQGPPFGAPLSRALRGLSTTSLVSATTLELPLGCPSIAPALTACSLRSCLAGCSSSPPRATTILSSLGISFALCTLLRAHTLRADASVGTESARLVVFAHVRQQVPGTSWDPYTGCECMCSVFMGSNRHQNLSCYHRWCLGCHGI